MRFLEAGSEKAMQGCSTAGIGKYFEVRLVVFSPNNSDYLLQLRRMRNIANAY